MRLIRGGHLQVAVAVASSALGLIGAVLVVRDVQLGEIVRVALSADRLLLLWALLAVQLANVAKGLRWGAIVGPGSGGLPTWTALVYLGQAINNFAPARAGDLAKLELQARRSSLDRARLLGSVAAEKLIDLVILGALFVCLLPFLPGLDGLDPARIGGGAGLALAVLAGLAAGVPMLRRSLPGRGAFIASLAGRFAEGAGVLRRRAGFPAAAWGVASWLLGGLANYWTLRALGVQDAWLPSFVLLLVLYAGAPVPALPGRVGLHQALSIVALAPFGLPSGLALAVAGIVYLQSLIVPSLIGGALGVWFVRGSFEVARSSGVAPRSA